LLLAVEMGMALAAVCVVPLIFVELPIQETGIIKALWARAGDLLDLSRQATRLILALILPLLLLVVSLSVWWFRHIQRTWNEPRSCREIE
jgi:hypothetical protein